MVWIDMSMCCPLNNKWRSWRWRYWRQPLMFSVNLEVSAKSPGNY